jgi:hypothetical protein
MIMEEIFENKNCIEQKQRGLEHKLLFELKQEDSKQDSTRKEKVDYRKVIILFI